MRISQKKLCIISLLTVFIVGCGGGGMSAVTDDRAVPAPEATFGSMSPGSTAMQSERFKTRGTLGVFSGQVIERSDVRSSGVRP